MDVDGARSRAVYSNGAAVCAYGAAVQVKYACACHDDWISNSAFRYLQRSFLLHAAITYGEGVVVADYDYAVCGIAGQRVPVEAEVDFALNVDFILRSQLYVFRQIVVARRESITRAVPCCPFNAFMVSALRVPADGVTVSFFTHRQRGHGHEAYRHAQRQQYAQNLFSHKLSTLRMIY